MVHWYDILAFAAMCGFLSYIIGYTVSFLHDRRIQMCLNSLMSIHPVTKQSPTLLATRGDGMFVECLVEFPGCATIVGVGSCTVEAMRDAQRKLTVLYGELGCDAYGNSSLMASPLRNPRC